MLKSLKMGLRSISRRLSRARTRLSRGRWVHATRVPDADQPFVQETIPAQSSPKRLEQLPLFDDLAVYEMAPKFSRRKPRKRSKKKPVGLQYKIKLRFLNRKIAFKPKLPKDVIGDNPESFSTQGAKKLHWILLLESLKELRECAIVRSGRVAEILQWFLRRDCSEPFAFETCLAIAGEFDEEYRGADPDVFRRSLLKEIQQDYGGVPPHRDLLRHAIIDCDYGSADALAWMQSNDDSELSFVDCCEAMGFTAPEARRQLGITAVQESNPVTDLASAA